MRLRNVLHDISAAILLLSTITSASTDPIPSTGDLETGFENTAMSGNVARSEQDVSETPTTSADDAITTEGLEPSATSSPILSSELGVAIVSAIRSGIMGHNSLGYNSTLTAGTGSASTTSNMAQNPLSTGPTITAGTGSASTTGNMAHQSLGTNSTFTANTESASTADSTKPSSTVASSTTDTHRASDQTTVPATTDTIATNTASDHGTTGAAGLLTVDGSKDATVGSAPSVTGSPVLTPSPAGGSGAISTAIPPLESQKPDLAVIIDDETYVLPQDGDLELVQGDGSTIVLSPGMVVSGSDTIFVPEAAAPTSLTAGALSIEAGPAVEESAAGSSGSSSGGGGAGGAGGGRGLTDVLSGLSGTANSITNAFDQISGEGVSFAANGGSFETFSTSIGPSLDSAISDLTSFVSKVSSTIDGFSSGTYELEELTEDGLRRVFEARNGGVKQLDLPKSLRKLTLNVSKVNKEAVELASKSGSTIP